MISGDKYVVVVRGAEHGLMGRVDQVFSFTTKEEAIATCERHAKAGAARALLARVIRCYLPSWTVEVDE